MIVRTSPDKIREVNQQIETEWKATFPLKLYPGKLQSSLRNYTEETNNNVVKIFLFMGSVATMLSLTGLFSLVTLSIIRKMKEIGIRKILGASPIQIILIINKAFITILILSCLVGVIIGYFMSGAILSSSWAYYSKAGSTVFISSALLLLCCAATVIIGNTYKIALSNPSDILKQE